LLNPSFFETKIKILFINKVIKKILDIEKMMRPEEIAESGITNLSELEQQAIFRWGLLMFGLGQHKVGDIHEIKYDGRVVVLDDGSRWEVDSYDASTVDFFGGSLQKLQLSMMKCIA
jgi:hypothetical protein